jgi:hypothetical protein
MTRRRTTSDRTLKVSLPARRAACRPRYAALDEPGRMYVAGWEPDGHVSVDVVDDRGILNAHWTCGDEAALSIALLSDATGHRPQDATATAFRREVLSLLPRDGFAISSQEVCAWLLIRAIERLER